MMRQANFPDQKALTARDETNSKPSQQFSWFSESSGDLAAYSKRKPRAGNGPFPLPPLTGHPYHCFGQCIEGSSVLIQSITSLCKAPKWTIHNCFFLRAICHMFPWGDQDCVLQFVNAYAQVRTDTNRDHFFWAKSFSLPDFQISLTRQEELEHLHCWTAMGTWGNVQGVRLLHSENTEPTSVWCRALPAGFLFTDSPSPPFWVFLFIS